MSQLLKGFRSSILGMMLCDGMYDEVLKRKFSVRVVIVGFADDITSEVYGACIEKVELTVASSI